VFDQSGMLLSAFMILPSMAENFSSTNNQKGDNRDMCWTCLRR